MQYELQDGLLTKNISKIVNSDWLYRSINGQVNNLTKDSSFIASNVSHLGNLRLKIPKKIIFSYININSIRNKFENVCEIAGNNVDVSSISETKLESSFPNAEWGWIQIIEMVDFLFIYRLYCRQRFWQSLNCLWIFK